MRYCFTTDDVNEKHEYIIEKYAQRLYDDQYCVVDEDALNAIKRVVKTVYEIPTWKTIRNNNGPFYYPFKDHVDLSIPVISKRDNRHYFLSNDDQMIMLMLYAILPPSLQDDTVFRGNFWISFIHFSPRDEQLLVDGVTLADIDTSHLDDLIAELKASRMKNFDVPVEFTTLTIDDNPGVELDNYTCKPARILTFGPNRGMYIPNVKPADDVTLNVLPGTVAPNDESTVFQPGSFWSAKITYRGLVECDEYVYIKLYAYKREEESAFVEEEEEQEEAENPIRMEVEEEEEERDVESKEIDYDDEEIIQVVEEEEEEAAAAGKIGGSEEKNIKIANLPFYYSTATQEPILLEGKVRPKIDVVVHAVDDVDDLPAFDEYDTRENDLLPLYYIVSRKEMDDILYDVGKSQFVYSKKELVKVPNSKIFELLALVEDKILSQEETIDEDKLILAERILDYAAEKRKIK